MTVRPDPAVHEDAQERVRACRDRLHTARQRGNPDAITRAQRSLAAALRHLTAVQFGQPEESQVEEPHA